MNVDGGVHPACDGEGDDLGRVLREGCREGVLEGGFSSDLVMAA